MKNYFILLAISVCSLAFGQKAMRFSDAKENNIRVSWLDSTYASGINADSSLCIFKTNQAEYIAAYQNLLQDLGNFLKANGFAWEKPTHGFNRIYFSADGKIDYFLYSFRPDQLLPDQEKKFGELLSLFISAYRFPLTAPVKFAQCSPVTYMPAEK